MKTIDLQGAALDWAVAKCEGLSTYLEVVEGFQPSTDWVQGGQIIEREKLDLENNPPGGTHEWYAVDQRRNVWGGGQTPLIAAMRCYVASKLGAEVEIPQELTTFTK